MRDYLVRRRWLGLALLLLLIGVASSIITAVIVLSPKDSITIEHFQQIKIGMSELEVEEILGGPAGYYTHKPRIGVTRIQEPDEGTKEWWGEDALIIIRFNEERRVAWKALLDLRPGKGNSVYY